MTLKNKRRAQRAGLSLALSLAAAFVAPAALAAAPMAKTSAPGYYRMMLGDFEVTALSDGTATMPLAKLLTGIKEKDAEKAMARYFQKSPAELSVNAYLINTGAKLVLIDTGTAKLFGPTLGNMLANLKAAGYQPEQVDEIYITHLHGDHVGGLMAGDQMAFPNAVVRADKADADFWLSQANMDKAQGDDKDFFKGAMASLNPYVKAGKFKAIEGDGELVPGVRAMATHGHTPGHNIYLVESKGQKLLLWGDLMHVASVQFDRPEVTIAFDSDSKAAKAQRLKVFAMAAKEGYIVGAAHVSYPGLGRLRAEGKGYVWVPVNYSPVK